MAEQFAVEMQDIHTRFKQQVIHSGVSFKIPTGKITALIGGSGSGKTVLLRQMIGLRQPTSGDVKLLGKDLSQVNEEELKQLRKRIGVLFQNGALFSALTVGENVAVPLVEQTKIDPKFIPDIVALHLGLTGLSPETANKMPSELSGGMVKRAALARALVLEPECLFLDEPTSGLDPINARAFDRLIRTLSQSLGLTALMVTHDLDSILEIAENIIVLGQGKVIAQGTVGEVVKVNDPWIKEYFSARMP